MASLLLIFAGLAVTFGVSDFFGSDNETEDTNESMDEGPQDGGPPGDDIILVEDGTVHVGDDDQQVYLFDPEASGPVTAEIDAGGGDDIIELDRLFDGIGLAEGSVDAGAGDDFVSVSGFGVSVLGGAGDDTILAQDDGSSTISGGDGNDLMRVVDGEGDVTIVDGGAGNDTIDGSDAINMVLSGGDGDDSILTRGNAPSFGGFTVVADGGEGDDTLTHEVIVFPLPGDDELFSSPVSVSGGAGADVFDIQLVTENGSFSSTPEDPEVFSNTGPRITDFTPGTDVLSVDLGEADGFYDFESGTLTENTTTASTLITLRLVSESLPDQDISIRVDGTNLSWDDVAFVGTPPPNLFTA